LWTETRERAQRFVVRVLLLLAVAFGACTDDTACIDAVCPAFEEKRTFIGPCRSVGEIRYTDTKPTKVTYDFQYDDSGRISVISNETDGWTRSTSQLDNEHPFHSSFETRWMYDANAYVAAIDTTGRFDVNATWRFEATRVTAVGPGLGSRVYDRSMFSFLPLPGSELAVPDAELGLVEANGGSYSWVKVDSTLWVRNGSDTVARFTLDERGRIVGVLITFNGTDRFTTFSYEYEGDNLVKAGVRTYKYDFGGNLVERDVGDNQREVYSYDCW
jgi:hypothetical protein